MISGDAVLFTIISAESTITDLLDDYAGGKAVINDIILPQDFDGKKSINIYLVSPIPGGLDYKNETYSVDCRAGSYSEARAIANAVVAHCNRYYQDDLYLSADIQILIKPQNDRDTYNIPIEILYRSKQ